MGGVDQMRHALFTQVGGQPRDTAKTTDAHRQGLGDGRTRPTGITQHRRYAAFRQQARQRARLSRPAEQEEVGHG